MTSQYDINQTTSPSATTLNKTTKGFLLKCFISSFMICVIPYMGKKQWTVTGAIEIWLVLAIYITNQLTSSNELSPSAEANKSSVIQQIPRNLWNPYVHTTIASACHMSLSRATPIQSMPPHPTFWRSLLIVSYQLHLRLPSGSFPQACPSCCHHKQHWRAGTRLRSR